ncbi:glycoside hydrolase family 43 protein [Fodinicola acaciae]|uniref:glycoside hydrolase family 43 protein n=1 Tax=Fodinicola acaciae TaxID=2681555 RepID=UPI0013D8BD61|nr:glycoside hydrolase family 43 protein [Fodinicola acaciae]
MRRVIRALVAAFLVVACLAAPAQAAPASTTFRNPLNAGPDPFLTWYQGNYYLSTTQGDAIRIWKAPSLNQLLAAPANTVWRDSDGSRNQQVWAPEFYFLDGHWYVYYTADDGVDANHRIYVVESDGTDPLGPYHFKAKLQPANLDVWAIDPTILQLGGRLYLGFSSKHSGNNSLYIAPMSNPYTLSGNGVYLPASGCTSDTVREAPEFVHSGGKTWMVYSTCDTGKPDYQLWEKSLNDGLDPLVAGNWVQHSGAVFSRNDSTGVYGPGHHAFFTSPDGAEQWIVYAAKNTSAYTYDGRTTRAQRIGFNADGSPDFGSPLAAGATQNLPAGDPGSQQGWINDDGRTSGDGAIAYAGDGWLSGGGCGVQCFWSDDHWNGTAGATATYSFTGTQIALLSVRDTNYGYAALSIDGGPETTIDLYSSIRMGEQVNYVSPRLAAGSHTLRVRVTGDKDGASSGTLVEIDRAEIYG